MQVALQALALPLAGVGHSRARALQVLETSSEGGVQATVLERDASRRGDGGEQLALIVQRGIVEQHGHMRAVAVDQGHRSLGIPFRQLHGPAVEIGEAPVFGQPEAQRQRWIAQRASQGVANVRGHRILPQLDEEIAHRRAGQAVMQQPDQEGDRRKPEGEKGRPPDLRHHRTAERG